MDAKIVIVAIALAAAFIAGTHGLAGEARLEVFALFLALTSCVYGGAALTPAGARFAGVELPFVAVVFTSAVAGLVVSPLWIAVGYLLHGAWDVLHHAKTIETPVLGVFPPLCAIFDAVVGSFVLVWWLWLS
jgi:hypothetical protein